MEIPPPAARALWLSRLGLGISAGSAQPEEGHQPDDILEKVTVKVELPDDSIRYFNDSWSAGRLRAACAPRVHPGWFLTRTTDCRIFQEMTVPDIVKVSAIRMRISFE
jgi:type VI secretion system secreted protein VgrG